MGLPERCVVRAADRRPGVLARPLPVVADHRGQQVVHLGGDPRPGVHPVGDRPDRRLGVGDVGPEVAEHLATDLAVQARHAVASLSEPHAHHCHVEQLVGGLVGPVPQFHQPLDRDPTRLGPVAEVPLDQLPGEPIDAGGHRSVGGEHRAGADRLERLVEAEAVELHATPDPLESEEAGMALVGVEHLDVDTQRIERPDPADAEEDLLAETVLHVAPVEAVGHQLERLGVLGKVGVEQVQRRAPDIRPPDLCLEHLPVELHLDAYPVAQLQRHRMRVQVREALLLPAVDAERLTEVPVAVEEADRNEGDPQVRCRLQVVTREHSEPARVLGNRLADPELRGEVGDDARSVRTLGRGDVLLVPACTLEVGRECVVGRAHVLEEGRIGRELLEAGRGRLGEHPPRIVSAVVPHPGVDGGEQVPCRAVPRPSQVARQAVERDERLGESGADREAAECLHHRRGYRRCG